MSHVSRVFPIVEPSQIGEVRRHAQLMADRLEFAETNAGQLAIAVTELCGNIIKHGGGGEMLLRSVSTPSFAGIEILALDSGKGMANVRQCLEDGYSTAGSPGTGLGAVKRLASAFDVYSAFGKGTAVLARCAAKPPSSASHPFETMTLGTVCVCYPGESVCGDGWSVISYGQTVKILMVDGLGHGQYAAEAAGAAIQAFAQRSAASPLELIHVLHAGLRSSRGAAAAIAEVDLARGQFHFAGVGNIAGTIYGGERDRGLMSYNGTLGHQIHKIQEIPLPWPQNGLLIMHSDGLSAKFKLDDYPGLSQAHPALIAGILYRDFYRKRDDVTVLVARNADHHGSKAA